MSIVKRIGEHAKNRIFQGVLPTGGMEGASKVERFQSIYLNPWEPGDWLLGRVHDWDLVAGVGKSWQLGHTVEGHLWIMGSTRARKGTSQIIQNVARHPGNQMIVDPKGEAYYLLGDALEAKGYEVVLLDPMRRCAKFLGGHSTRHDCHYNPLFDINAWDEEAPRMLAELAEILIEKPEGDGNESSGGAHWNRVTRIVTAGLLAYSLVIQSDKSMKIMAARERRAMAQAAADGRTVTEEDFDYSDAEQKRICATRNIVAFCADFPSMSHEQRIKILERMLRFDEWCKSRGMAVPPVGRMIKLGAQQAMSTLGPKSYAEGMVTLLSCMANAFMWIDSPAMERSLLGFDFKFRMGDLKKKNKLAVFVVLPDTALKSHGGWLRLVVNSAINSIAANDWAPDVASSQFKIHLILDECPQYGRIPALARLFEIGAGQGARAIIISQNMTQMDQVYGVATRESLIANSAQVLLAGGDNTTGGYFATKAGKTYRRDEETGEKGDDKTNVWGPDEVWRVVYPERDTLTYWQNGRGPQMIRLVEYFEDGELKAGVDYRQHRDHATIDDQFLTRGGFADLASRPREATNGHNRSSNHDVADPRQIWIGGDQDSPLQLTHKG